MLLYLRRGLSEKKLVGIFGVEILFVARPRIRPWNLALTFHRPPNGEVEGPPRSARSSAAGAQSLQRLWRVTTSRSRSPPTIVRRPSQERRGLIQCHRHPTVDLAVSALDLRSD